MLDLRPLQRLIESELETDRVRDDVTTRLLGKDRTRRAQAVVFTKQLGVFSGKAVCEAFPFSGLKVECLVEDGTTLEVGMPVARLTGTIEGCLGAERTLLNFLSHCSGVATLTRRFVDAVKPHPTKILATRKTLPGLRDIQLQAVRAGGGHIHRRSLSDGILVKDNHLVFLDEARVMSAARLVKSPLHRVEVEVQSLEQLSKVLADTPDVVMLDNFTLGEMRTAMQKIAGRCEVEVSGGMDLDHVAAIAALGVQYISVGRLTHSAPALDLSLDIQTEAP